MQWLIDIISANVITTIGIPPCFIDRGDKAAYDWSMPFWTIDAAWHSLDLSGIIPVEATAVGITLQVVSGAVSNLAIFMPRVTGGNSNQSAIFTQVANIGVRQDMTVPIGPNRTIQYLIVPGGWTAIDVGVKGWWL